MTNSKKFTDRWPIYLAVFSWWALLGLFLIMVSCVKKATLEERLRGTWEDTTEKRFYQFKPGGQLTERAQTADPVVLLYEYQATGAKSFNYTVFGHYEKGETVYWSKDGYISYEATVTEITATTLSYDWQRVTGPDEYPIQTTYLTK